MKRRTYVVALALTALSSGGACAISRGPASPRITVDEDAGRPAPTPRDAGAPASRADGGHEPIPTDRPVPPISGGTLAVSPDGASSSPPTPSSTRSR